MPGIREFYFILNDIYPECSVQQVHGLNGALMERTNSTKDNNR